MKPVLNLTSHLSETLAGLVDGTLDDQGFEELQQLLASDSDALEAYLAYVDLHVCLPRSLSGLGNLAAGTAESNGPPEWVTTGKRSPVLGFLATISRHVPGGEFTVGSLLLMVIVAAFWGLSQAILFPQFGGHDLARESSHPPTVPPSHRSDTVATIRDESDVQWSPNSRLTDSSMSRSAPITANQPLSIQSGLVELQLNRGTTLLIEGPADWQINGENSATLTQGKLVAKVPEQAIGFTLETPTAKIIDLGTEFGVEVAKDGAADVHVSKGIVDVQSAGGSGKPGVGELKAGQSARITQTGATVETNASMPDKFKRLVDAGNIEPAALTTNPATGLVSYYPFDGDTKDHAAEYAASSGKHKDDLKLLDKAEFLAGQEGRALRLSGGYCTAPFSSDVQLPPTFTIEAWIVAEKLAGFQRLVANWRDFPTPIYVYHFNIKGKALELAIGQANGQLVRVTGGELKIERWQHVAAVSDGSQLRLYLNGEEVATGNFDGTLRNNDQEGLGVGDNAGGTGDIHRLHGAIDELAIWNVPLTAEQIAAHARSGTRGYRLTPLPKSP